jgi:type III secretion system YscQ/HrcQ family protein
MEQLNFWLKKIDPYFEELDEIPLFRGENFSFDDLSNALKQALSNEELEISCSLARWETKEEILEEFGEAPYQLCLVFTPLLGNVYLLIGKKELQTLTAELLLLDEKNHFPSFVLEEGFYRYLILLTLDEIKKSPTFEGLTPKIVEEAEIKSEEAMCLHLNLKISQKINLNVTIAITPDFRRSWNEFFLRKKSIQAPALKSMVEVPLRVIAGSVALSRKEIEALQEGDFVILDSQSSPNEKERPLLLKLNETPIFLAKMQDNQILIQDYANYYEEGEIMEEKEIPQKRSTEEEKIAPDTSEKSTSIEDLPIKISVELDKISMTLEKLTSLQPGNILHLSSTLDAPVKLTVSGQRIALAELIMVGETLGIRILQLG